MVEILKEIIKIEKKGKINQKELFDKIKKFLKDEKTEYPSFALTTMMIDAMTSGVSIYKVKKKFQNDSPIQEKFLEA